MGKKTLVIYLCLLFVVASFFGGNGENASCANFVELSSFQTDYTASLPTRKHNIALATSKLDGVVIGKGESLSFNKVVGKRSEERGYQTAIVIENGVYAKGVGGGVCQVSTTLYNSALRAGMKILQVNPHSLAPEYVDTSFDAMVSEEGSDLVIKNLYDFPVRISAKCQNGKIIFKFLAERKIEGLEIIPYCEITKTINPPKTVEKPETDFEEIDLEPSEVITFRKPKQGVVSRGFLLYKYNGVVVRIKQIRSDVYIPVQGVQIRGVNKEETM